MSSGEKKRKRKFNWFQHSEVLGPVAPIAFCLTNKNSFLLPAETLHSLLFQPMQTKEISKSISLRKDQFNEYFFFNTYKIVTTKEIEN